MSEELATQEPGSDEPAAPSRDDTPASLPAATFWACGPGAHALDDPTPFGQENALQKLGKPPFEKSTRSRFRLLGYFATVYEHVSQDLSRGMSPRPGTNAGEAS